MFVSGVPGTGKTATIRNVARSLLEERDAGTLPHFQFVEVNGMALTTPQQVFVEIWTGLSETQSRVTTAHAVDLLAKRFTTPSPRRHCAVVLVDELDQLCTRRQEILYNLFDWPNHQHSRLIVVAVANTMDLPERVLAHRVSSRLGITRLTFSPYTRHQLVTIVASRLEGLDAVSPEAIELCSRKVAAISGDARRALDICRRAVEIAQQGSVPMKVQMEHISAALQEMTASPIIVAMTGAARHEKLFLIALLSQFHRSGLEEAVFNDVVSSHLDLCRLRGITPPSVSSLSAICSRLGTWRLLLLEHAHLDNHRRIRLNCTREDVLFALREEPALASL